MARRDTKQWNLTAHGFGVNSAFGAFTVWSAKRGATWSLRSILSQDAKKLIDIVGLDDPVYRDRRRLIQRMVTIADQHDPVLYRMLLGVPEDLPDLSRRKPPQNSRLEGVEISYHARRKEGRKSWLPEANPAKRCLSSIHVSRIGNVTFGGVKTRSSSFRRPQRGRATEALLQLNRMELINLRRALIELNR